MPLPLDRLIYIDDSGHPQSGLVIYGWIEFQPDHWSSVLRNWLDLRKRLWREYNIPVTQELHTTEYANGRGRISTKMPDRFVHEGNKYWKDLGREVALECLETLRSTEGLRLGSVYRRGTPQDLAQTRSATYKSLINIFELELEKSESLAMIVMDGDGSDSSYKDTHRSLELSKRHVIEDAIHLDSKNSQLVQMADLVAWSANAFIDQHSKNRFAQEWYPSYLSERDPSRFPREI
ncbi:DUF3800 domain-containing protein [Glutamicibacter uratoxydans]|uniref:DUF3800 domain-containing protein n=1 Tax=Glutamicibacter uratoxydans TaxID=43667 RepID=UPI00114207ED|nr:DUF3800 domain-containing protein [Glutamicibacter uratoxydans]